MKTIAFYSYKGGVGRTLALANIARYLSLFGQRVFAMDLDLEAPGLHYKLVPELVHSIHGGFLDYIHSVLSSERPPLAVLSVPLGDEGGAGQVTLFPAGRVPSLEYWKQLASINWHDLFYGEAAYGVPIFLELKERIKEEFAPDFLLIDARTGITEVGGVATAILADQVVCLLAHNAESLDGTRAVLRGIADAPQINGVRHVEVFPVLARIPDGLPQETELALTTDVLHALADMPESIIVREPVVLHSEPGLQILEQLKFGREAGVSDTRLTRDYLRLLSLIVPKEVIQPRIQAWIDRAIRISLEDPETAQAELEGVAVHHPAAVLALLQFYRLRRASPEKVLDAARRYWELTADAIRTIELLKPVDRLVSGAANPAVLGFLMTLFERVEPPDIELGMVLVRLGPTKNELPILMRLVNAGSVAAEVVLGAARRLADGGKRGDAEHLLLQHLGTLKLSETLVDVLCEVGSPAAITDFLNRRRDELGSLQLVRLLLASRQNDEASLLAAQSLDRMRLSDRMPVDADDPMMDTVAELSRAFSRYGGHIVFEDLVRARLAADDAIELLEYIRKWRPGREPMRRRGGVRPRFP